MCRIIENKQYGHCLKMFQLSVFHLSPEEDVGNNRLYKTRSFFFNIEFFYMPRVPESGRSRRNFALE